MDLDFSFFGFSPNPRKMNSSVDIKGTNNKTSKLKTTKKCVASMLPHSAYSTMEVGLHSRHSTKLHSKVLKKSSEFHSENNHLSNISRKNSSKYVSSNVLSEANLNCVSSSLKETNNTSYNSVIVISDGESSLEDVSSSCNRVETYRRTKFKRSIAARRRVNVPSVVGSSSCSSSEKNVIPKMHQMRTIILESSDDSDKNGASNYPEKDPTEKKTVRVNVPSVVGSSSCSSSEKNVILKKQQMHSIILESSDDSDTNGASNCPEKDPTEKKIVNDIDKPTSTICTPLLRKSKQLDIEKWLEGNDHSDCNLSYQKTIMMTPQMTANAKDKESRRNDVQSAKKVLDELYGQEWRTIPNVIKHHSSDNQTESDDGFENLLQKYVPKYRDDGSSTHSPSIDFINDRDVTENSFGFYQALLNKTTTDMQTGRTPSNVPANRKLFHSNESNNKENGETQENAKLLKTKKPAQRKVVVSITTKKTLDGKRKEPPTKITAKPKPLAGNCGANMTKESELFRPARSFMESLSALTPAVYCDPEAQKFKSHFQKKKDLLFSKLFEIFNSAVFENKLAKDMKLEWNVRLNKTAGYCYYRSVAGSSSGERIRSARIELSSKVCDTPERLRDTLIHELCHAATWIVNGVRDGHGKWWKAWAARSRKCFPELPPINRCHAYTIETKYSYECTLCGYTIKRHSKSLDIVKKRCGYCYGIFKLIINFKGKKHTASSSADPKTPKNVNGFALYVKENYSSVKKPELKHGDVMKLLGKKFSAVKLLEKK